MQPFDHACLGAGAHLVVVAVQLVVAVNCVACALVRNKTVCGEDLSRAVKYGGSAACRVAVCERAADLSDEILRSIADEKIFAMCRGVKVDADVVEAARAELERRRAGE